MNAHMNMQPTQTSSKSLQALLAGLASVESRQECCINGLNLDSRQIAADELFIAVPGANSDGRDHIQQAVHNGAVAIAYEKSCDARDQHDNAHDHGVPSFAIADLNQHVGTIAARFFEEPSTDMRVLGITGTNGKTTCAYLLAQALDALGTRCALMGTIGSGFIGELQPSALTTDNAIETHRTLAALLQRKAEAVCIETSSHGLDQGRVNHVAFDVAVLTNLSQDHLDYHGSMQQYAEAKQKLFEFDGLDSAVINVGDPFGRELLQRHAAAQCISYGIDDGDVRPRNLELNQDGIVFEVEYRGQVEPLRCGLIGTINLPNLLATVATLICCGYELGQIVATASKWSPPPGRMELVHKHASQPAVVIDYAHTPDALERALSSLAVLCRGKLWVVFGCGGERDRDKRPQMGKVAELLADHVIVTNDNPRGEQPEQITEQIVDGMNAPAQIIHDRASAIETAIASASAEDMVLVAGKGHEATQTIGTRILELNDRDLVATALNHRMESRS